MKIKTREPIGPALDWAVVSVANSEEDAERYEENPQFVRWLTGWAEYEE